MQDINRGQSGSGPGRLTLFNSKIYFRAFNSEFSSELWSIDNSETASLVKDIKSGGSSAPDELTVALNRLYFRADDGSHGYELWACDASDECAMVKDINSGSEESTP